MIAAIGVVAVVAVAVGLLTALVRRDPASDRVPARAADPVAALVAWLDAGVAPTTRLVVDDPALAERVQAATDRALTADAPVAGDVLVSGVGASTDPRQPRRVDDARSVVPFAVFGDGATRIAAGGVVDRPLAALTADRTAVATTAGLAARDLLANPEVVVAPAVRSALLAGAVDLRVTAGLAILAARRPVVVLAVVTDPAERDAGLPARAVAVDGAPGEVDATLSAARAPYRPAVTRDGGGRTRLTWPLEAEPRLALR